MKLKDLCGPPFVIGITPEASARAAAKKMLDDHVGALIVVGHDGKVAGVVTDRDLALRVVAAGKNPETTRVGEIMSKPAKTAREDLDVRAAAMLMIEGRVRRLPIVDAEGRAKGMTSLDDLVAAAADHLRELAAIVGDARAAARLG
jgi:CBS domain-containing protein